jgi:hypothetical protein
VANTEAWSAERTSEPVEAERPNVAAEGSGGQPLRGQSNVTSRQYASPPTIDERDGSLGLSSGAPNCTLNFVGEPSTEPSGTTMAHTTPCYQTTRRTVAASKCGAISTGRGWWIHTLRLMPGNRGRFSKRLCETTHGHNVTYTHTRLQGEPQGSTHAANSLIVSVWSVRYVESNTSIHKANTRASASG